MQDTSRVFKIPSEMMEELEHTISTAPAESPPYTPTEYSMSVITIGAGDRTLFTFVELDSYPVFRISQNGASTDHVLNSDQVKLLLRQMTLWLTR